MHSFFSLVVPLLLFSLTQTNAVIWVESNEYYDDFTGIFSTNFIGIEMTSGGYVGLPFVAGDDASATYVLSLPNQEQTSPAFFQNNFTIIFESTGTWWIYAAIYGTTSNYDFIQIRVVPDTFEGTISPLYTVPPEGWENGYPPEGSEMIAGGATSPSVVVIGASNTKRNSIAVWLAPLLVGLIVTVIGITATFVAYKKGICNKGKRVVDETANKLAQQPQSIELQTQPTELLTQV